MPHRPPAHIAVPGQEDEYSKEAKEEGLPKTDGGARSEAEGAIQVSGVRCSVCHKEGRHLLQDPLLPTMKKVKEAINIQLQLFL